MTSTIVKCVCQHCQRVTVVPNETIRAALSDYRHHIDSVNRSTDREISEAMDELLRKQSQVNVLRPAKEKFRPAGVSTP